MLAAIRLARTVTGRTRIATTSGYHGINDEVLVRASVVDGVRRPVPIAPGIPQHAVDQVLVLDYGSPESLELLRAHAHELAAVLIEPVQARRPDLQPLEFLREVRKITAESGTALIFDELITGFRTAPGGAQAYFGIEADMVTYGKIIGGGIADRRDLRQGEVSRRARRRRLAVRRRFRARNRHDVFRGHLRAPSARHPRGAERADDCSSARAPALQDELSARTARFARRTQRVVREGAGADARSPSSRSMMYFVFQQEFKYASLLFFHLRLKGLHIWEGRPCFFSTAHTDEEIGYIIDLFQARACEELRAADFIPKPATPEIKAVVKRRAISTRRRPPEPIVRPDKPMEYSLYFFGNYDAAYREDKYSLLQDAAKFADDAHGFTAAWLPERHFHAVGGFSPNSSLLACSLAAVTKSCSCAAGASCCRCIIPCAWRRNGRSRTISPTGAWPFPSRRAGIRTISFSRRKISRIAATSALQNLEIIQPALARRAGRNAHPERRRCPSSLHPLPKQGRAADLG